MSCDHARKFMDAYMDGELEAAAMLEVESHLEECPVCRALYDLKQKMKSELVRYGQNIKAPPHLRARIESMSASSSRRIWKIAAAAAIPVAAAAAFLLIFLTGGEPNLNQEQMTAVVDDVVERHSGTLPMEVKSADPAEAASWFRGKVDFPVRAPGARFKNASLQGARVSNVQAEQAAQMVYQIDGHRVTLMIFPSDKISVRGGNLQLKNGKKILTGTRRGYNVAMMKEGDIVYAVSSDLPVSRLVSLLTDTHI